MKKSLLLAALALTGSAVNAQLTNLGFEGSVNTVAPYGDQPQGWAIAFHSTVLTTGSYEGSKHLKLETAVNSTLATAINAQAPGFTTDTVAGYITQVYSGAISSLPTSVDAAVKFAPAGVDVGAILITYFDDNGTPSNTTDDITIAQAGDFFTAAIPNWTSRNMPVQTINAGTANMVRIMIVASAEPYVTVSGQTLPAPQPGTELEVDGIVFNTPSGVTDIAGNAIQVNVYPNPASELINFATEEEGLSLQVFDLSGKLVLSGAMEKGKNTFHINQLENGSYIYMVKAENGTVVAKDKFVVVR